MLRHARCPFGGSLSVSLPGSINLAISLCAAVLQNKGIGKRGKKGMLDHVDIADTAKKKCTANGTVTD